MMINNYSCIDAHPHVLLKSSDNINLSACAHDKLQSLNSSDAIFHTNFPVDKHKL